MSNIMKITSHINTCSNDQFEKIVKESSSIKEISQKLGYNAHSGTISAIIKQRIQSLQIDISHFTQPPAMHRTPENIFTKDSTATQNVLRRYYKKGNYTPYICSICGQQPTWQGKPLTLILDHINGRNRDNRLNNLRWVCPNCNMQLDTTGSKNKAYKNDQTPNTTLSVRKPKQQNHCIDCGKPISKTATRCKECDNKTHRQKPTLPCSREELKSLIRTKPFTTIGKMFDVSDNTIRKWCQRYNLPTQSSKIKHIDSQTWSTI